MPRVRREERLAIARAGHPGAVLLQAFEVITLNFARFAREVVAHVRERRWGRIVGIQSTARSRAGRPQLRAQHRARSCPVG